LIEQKSAELGFDGCAITTASAPGSATHFRKWLDAGRHGEMSYLGRNAHKRIDPDLVLHGAKSIICLAASYHRHNSGEGTASQPTISTAPAPTSRLAQADNDSGAGRVKNSGQSLQGEIARYAQYSDYHEVLGAQLRQLTEFLNQLGGPDTRSLWYVDTGPFLERDLAERAGLGFIGKHTNLISRRLGNWFFLAEIITTLEIDPGTPEKNRCGSCTRCLAACPTQAILAPFQLDARRCISYLTIELKGSIPVELRPAIGTRIYGCDDCLAVCPWNRFAKEGHLMRSHARADMILPDLIELLALDQNEFKRRFANTPMLRTKRRGLLRNVCVALGNLGDPRALPALQDRINDPEPLIAEHAQWAMERLKG
jgi:epoxyqueuosine reductase